MFNKEIKCLHSHQKKKTKNKTKKTKNFQKAKTKREEKKIQNKQTNKAENQPLLETCRHEPPPGLPPREGVSGPWRRSGRGARRGDRGRATPQEPPGRRRRRPGAARETAGPARGPGPGRQERDWSGAERCPGGSSRHPGGRQVRDPAPPRGRRPGRPARRGRPRTPPPELSGALAPGSPLGPADAPFPSFAFCPVPILPFPGSSWVGGKLSHQPFLLKLFPPPSTPPLTFSHSVACLPGQGWVKNLGCGAGRPPFHPRMPPRGQCQWLLASRDSISSRWGLGRSSVRCPSPVPPAGFGASNGSSALIAKVEKTTRERNEPLNMFSERIRVWKSNQHSPFS